MVDMWALGLRIAGDIDAQGTGSWSPSTAQGGRWELHPSWGPGSPMGQTRGLGVLGGSRPVGILIYSRRHRTPCEMTRKTSMQQIACCAWRRGSDRTRPAYSTTGIRVGNLSRVSSSPCGRGFSHSLVCSVMCTIPDETMIRRRVRTLGGTLESNLPHASLQDPPTR